MQIDICVILIPRNYRYSNKKFHFYYFLTLISQLLCALMTCDFLCVFPRFFQVPGSIYLGPSFCFMHKKGNNNLLFFFQYQLLHFIKYIKELYQNSETRSPSFRIHEHTFKIFDGLYAIATELRYPYSFFFLQQTHFSFLLAIFQCICFLLSPESLYLYLAFPWHIG